MSLEGFGGFFRPTAAERAAGRFMRAPDHDAGGDGGAGGGGGGADQGGKDAGADGGSDAAADAGGAGAGADQGADGDDASLLGDAGTKAGDGDGGADGDQGGKGDGAGKDAAAAADVPETYELKPFTVGEGDDQVQIEIDTALLQTVTPALKEAGVTQDQLAKLAPAVVPEIERAILTRQADNFAATKADWAKDVQKDPELGGAKWSETEALAAKALDRFGAPSVKDKDGKETNPFRVLLNESGLGNHPEMIRMFRKIGETIGEDSDLARGGQAAGKVDRLEVLYPDDVPSAKQGAK